MVIKKPLTTDMAERICELGRSVIDTEAQAVANLRGRIDASFARACELLLSCQGRVIVLGIGKSGHVGKKIAATFASTGTPAFFVHPAEASHGDLGMITQRDVVMALSYSGETEELITLLPLLKRLDIPVVSITGNQESTLARIATVNLDISITQEACPLGLAPTASTTTTLAMGDALAVALLETKGFTAEDFALSHPGGSLGRKLLLKVDEIMHSDEDMPLATLEMSLQETLVVITQKRLGMAAVVDGKGSLCGIFTDGDLRRTFNQGADLYNTKVQDVMTKQCKTITPGTLAVEALRLMEQHQITALVIINSDHQPQGVVHLHDLLRSGVV